MMKSIENYKGLNTRSTIYLTVSYSRNCVFHLVQLDSIYKRFTDVFESFLGNERLKDEVKSLIESDRLPHGIVLQGEDGNGCGFFANLLAAEYLKDDNGLVMRGIHPDCICVEGSGSSGEISVQSVRDALFEANKAAVTADGRRVILIKNAQMLNQSSSNALLKMLEEPPRGVIFIMTVNQDSDLLPTLISRSVIYRIHSPGFELCVSEVMRRIPECTKDKAVEIAQLYDGNIGLSLRALTDGNYASMSVAGSEFCKAALLHNRYGMMKWLSEAENRDDLRILLNSAILWFKGNRTKLREDYSLADKIITEVSEAFEEAGKYSNIKLVETRLAYKLGGNR